jgi:hypothetical protein
MSEALHNLIMQSNNDIANTLLVNSSKVAGSRRRKKKRISTLVSSIESGSISQNVEDSLTTESTGRKKKKKGKQVSHSEPELHSSRHIKKKSHDTGYHCYHIDEVSNLHGDLWSSDIHEERRRIREFWLQLGEEERRALVKVEKDAVLQKLKEQQKRHCSCTFCGRKR